LLLLRGKIIEDVAGLNLALVLGQLTYTVDFLGYFIVFSRGQIDVAQGNFGDRVVEIEEFKLDFIGLTLLIGRKSVNRDFWNYIPE